MVTGIDRQDRSFRNLSKEIKMRKYTKMGKKQKGPESGETEARDRAGKRGAKTGKNIRVTTSERLRDILSGNVSYFRLLLTAERFLGVLGRTRITRR
jgi:hypothetical protein